MWKIVKFGDVVNLQNGYAFKSKEYSSDGYFVMRITNVQKGYISNHNPRYVQIKSNSNLAKFILKEQDILLSLTGDVGRVGTIKKEHLPCVLNQRVAKINIIDESLLNKDFLFLFLNSDIFLKKVEKLAHGAAQSNVATKDIHNINFNLPPLTEQQHIVAKLDVELNEIDKVIAFTELKLHCLNAIFEKVLHDSTQHMAVNVKLGEVCDIQGKLISPIDKPYCNELHIGAGNIESISNKLTNVLSAKEEGLISGKFPFGTDSVLYSKIRPYLRKVHLPKHSGICSADIYPLIPNTKRLDRNYLYYLLLSQNFTNYAMSGSSRAGMPKVNRKHLFGYEFCLPEIKVQKSAVKKIEAVCSNVSNFKHIETQKISQFHSLKSAILKQELQSEVS